MMEVSIRILKDRQDTVRSNWGFVFALLCAVLWGTSYQGIGFLLQGEVFGVSPFSGVGLLTSSLFIAALIAAIIWFTSFLWLIPNGLVKEWVRFITSFGYRNALCLAAAFSGGVAAWCTYIIASSIDSTYSVIIVMFYPAIGMLISKRMLSEKVSRIYYLGLGIIVLGWIILYFPDLIFSDPFVDLPVYLIGAVAGVGWGIEGVLAAKIMETVDVSVVVSARYAYELIMWLIAAVLYIIFLPEVFLDFVGRFSYASFGYGTVLVVIALCLATNYLCWYKSFLLCGVCKGLAVSDVSGFVTVVVGMLLLTSFPDWSAVTACITMAVGVYLIYSDGSTDNSVIREVDRSRVPQSLALTEHSQPISDKQAVLYLIASRGPLWDHEVVDRMRVEEGRRQEESKRAYQLRTYLIEAAAMGILVPIEYAIDTGTHFSKGKLLTRYALTKYGATRIVQ